VPDVDRTEPLIVAGKVELSRPVALGNGGLQTTAGTAHTVGPRHRRTNGYSEDWSEHPHVAPPYDPRPADSSAVLGTWTGSDWWTKPTEGPRRASVPTQQTYADRPPGGALPVRVPQANLAPQLSEPTRKRSARRGADTSLDSAEAARTSMSALQRGFERGRNAAGGPRPESDTGRG
jgi:hypothetical protein